MSVLSVNGISTLNSDVTLHFSLLSFSDYLLSTFFGFPCSIILILSFFFSILRFLLFAHSFQRFFFALTSAINVNGFASLAPLSVLPYCGIAAMDDCTLAGLNTTETTYKLCGYQRGRDIRKGQFAQVKQACFPGKL